MLYKQPRFTVPAVGNSPERCAHGWVANGKCIFCGEVIVVITSDDVPKPDIEKEPK